MTPPAFDEACDSEGAPRPAYTALRRRGACDPLRPTAQLCRQLSSRPLDDGVRILPVPLVLDDVQHGAITAGVAQRALALQAFFRDLIRDDRRFVAGVGGPDERMLEVILRSERTSFSQLRQAWGSHDRDEVRFVYGPDLVRERNGAWVVIEDNVGCVGGAADSFFVNEAYAKAAGLPPAAVLSADLVRAVERWRELLTPRVRSGKIVAVPGCDPGEGDCDAPPLLEDARRSRLLGALGVEVVGERRLKRLLQPAAPAPQAVVNFASLGESLGARLFERLRVPLLNAPTTGLLGNKALLPYVGEMIRFFLAEEPLLRTAPTRILQDGELPDPAAGWVVKTTTGSGGSGVFVLGAHPPESLHAARLAVAAAGPFGAVAQRWIEGSTLPAHESGGKPSRIELRPITYVLGWEEALPGRQLVGKAVPALDRGALNNISRGASYVAVMCEAACPKLLDSG